VIAAFAFIATNLFDSAARAGTFAEWAHGWHDFYLMTGTAAVTLAGLLFVALSLHLDRLVEKNHEHLLGLSRATLTSFIFVLVGSLMMLVPGMSARLTGMMLATLGVVGVVTIILFMRSARHHPEGGFTLMQLRRRSLIPLVGYGMIVISGAGLLLGIPEMLYQMIAACCMLLGNAAGTSWELLVHVAASKRAERAQ
jgi:hypothetical protein